MKKLLLVDGSNLLFQMYFGMPARIVGSGGDAIHGTLGFVGALLKMIRMVRPDHVAVLFDGEHENPRTALDANYKANRSASEDDPFSQLPDIYRALDHLNLCHAETVDCETDDWIAGYVRQYGGECEIVIASMDSDFFQLIGPTVRVLRYRGKGSVVCDEVYIREKLGIEPRQYAGFKSLTGDQADNIPGVPGVGVKTAALLMREFGTLENLLTHSDRVAKPSVRASVAENEERIARNYRLIALEGARELPCSLSCLRWEDTGATTVQVLQAIGVY